MRVPRQAGGIRPAARPWRRSAEGGYPRIVPMHPVSASIVVADVTLPKIRYLCRPDG